MCEKMASMHFKLKNQNATDTYLVNGVNLSMYLQKFKEKARTVQDPKMKSFSSKEELIPKWDDKDFGYGPRDIL